MDSYGYGQLSWHFTRAPLTFPRSNVMHITYRSTPDHCLSEDKYWSSVLFMFTQICNMGINVRFMVNLGYYKFLEQCKYIVEIKLSGTYKFLNFEVTVRLMFFLKEQNNCF